jgi:uncharacterized protein Smg (DUF494 family)
MKNNILDILTFLFETYLFDEEHGDNRNAIFARLQAEGFAPDSIDKAFDWLENLHPEQELQIPDARQAVRIFHPQEAARLSVSARSLLTKLEIEGVITAAQREQIIASALALDTASVVDADDLKWVVTMVLFNQSEKAGLSVAWIENFLYQDQKFSYH